MTEKLFERNKQTKKEIQSQESKNINCGSKSKAESKITEKRAQPEKKQFQSMTIEPTTDKQTNYWPSVFLKQNISRLKKKTFSSPIGTQDFCRYRHIRYLQANLTANAQKFEFNMSKDTNDAFDSVKVVNPEKVYIPV